MGQVTAALLSTRSRFALTTASETVLHVIFGCNVRRDGRGVTQPTVHPAVPHANRLPEMDITEDYQ